VDGDAAGMARRGVAVNGLDPAQAAVAGSWGPAWLEWLLNETNQAEIRGVKDNARIVWYHSFTAAGPAPDEVAWCSSAQCAAFESNGIRSTRSKSAVSWTTWGVKLLQPRLGAVLCFGKSDPDAKGTGHVAQCAGWNAKWVLALGGNQGNKVSVAPRLRSTVIDIRWPTGVPL
jgi:uncharacterized protein (TIGR02594 family)